MLLFGIPLTFDSVKDVVDDDYASSELIQPHQFESHHHLLLLLLNSWHLLASLTIRKEWKAKHANLNVF